MPFRSRCLNWYVAPIHSQVSGRANEQSRTAKTVNSTLEHGNSKKGVSPLPQHGAQMPVISIPNCPALKPSSHRNKCSSAPNLALKFAIIQSPRHGQILPPKGGRTPDHCWPGPPGGRCPVHTPRSRGRRRGTALRIWITVLKNKRLKCGRGANNNRCIA